MIELQEQRELEGPKTFKEKVREKIKAKYEDVKFDKETENMRPEDKAQYRKMLKEIENDNKLKLAKESLLN